jgi:hypothetical protein
MEDVQHTNRTEPGYQETQFFSAGWVAEPWFRRHFRSKWGQRTAKVVAVFVVFVMLPLVGGAVFDKAFGYCIMDDGSPCHPVRAAHWSSDKYNAGKMGHDRFRFTDFRNPREARRLLTRKVRRELAKARAAGTLPAKVAQASPATLVSRLVSSSNCIGDQAYAPYSTGFNLCSWNQGSVSPSKDTVKKVGEIGFCAGGIFATFVTEGGTGLIVFESGACAWLGFVLWG